MRAGLDIFIQFTHITKTQISFFTASIHLISTYEICVNCLCSLKCEFLLISIIPNQRYILYCVYGRCPWLNLISWRNFQKTFIRLFSSWPPYLLVDDLLSNNSILQSTTLIFIRTFFHLWQGYAGIFLDAHSSLMAQF